MTEASHSKLRAGVVGAGVFGRHHARKYASDPRVELVGVHDLDLARATALAQELGVSAFPTLSALLDATAAVTIATPAKYHADSARVALAAGKHVLIEKPLATSLADADALVALSDQSQSVLACGHQERQVFEAMGLFSAPEQPLLIESVREAPWTGRCTDVSVTLDLMVHDLDLALTLMGEAPARIEADGRAVEVASADAIEARLDFAGGARAIFRASRIAPERARSMRLVYPSGEVRIDFLARTFENETNFPLNAAFAETPSGQDPLGANVRRFVDAALGLAPAPAVSGRDGRAVLAVALAADAAAGLPSLS